MSTQNAEVTCSREDHDDKTDHTAAKPISNSSLFTAAVGRGVDG